ncbi:MAG TPA: hypothetical protein VFA32_21125, partial [Dehalococcoidia bacterium]|nr:hypothetical protein [Dehalococcoidia bacterium]
GGVPPQPPDGSSFPSNGWPRLLAQWVDWFDGLDPVVICEAWSGCFRQGTRETISDLKNQRAKLRMELADLYPSH